MALMDPDPLAGLTLDATDILLLVGLLAVALVVNNLIQKRSIPIPEAISTILVGIAAGAVAVAFPQVNRNTFQKLEDASAKQFMLVFIAPIIFAEGYGMKSQQFFDNITRISMHAFVGTLISSLVVASMLYYLPPLTGVSATARLQLAECLAFGAMISSTDPVTTLAIFKEQQLAEHGRGHLYYSVLGESILNDAVAITLFDSFSDLVKSGEELSSAAAWRMVGRFCGTFSASTLIGVSGGIVTALILKSARLGAGSCDDEHLFFNVPEIGVVLVMAYVPFLLAQACGLSGIVAIMFAGITMRRYAHFNLTQVTRQIFLPTVELLASLCETYVFLILGLGVFLTRSAFSVPIISWAILGCLLGRALQVYLLSWLVNRISSAPQLSIREMHMVWLAGLRGGIAFMCALGFPDKAGHQDCLLVTTVIIVGASLLCLGWPTATALRCLGLQGSFPEETVDEAPRRPRLSWSRFASSTPARLASQKLRQLLMTSDAITQEEVECFEEAHSFASSGSAPGGEALASGGMGQMAGMSGLSGPGTGRLSAPVTGVAQGRESLGLFAVRAGRPSAPARLAGPGGRLSVSGRSSRMLCDM